MKSMFLILYLHSFRNNWIEGYEEGLRCSLGSLILSSCRPLLWGAVFYSIKRYKRYKE